jgi:hypothetical protein
MADVVPAAVSAELTRQAIARLQSGEWTAVGMASGGALTPLAEPLVATFGEIGRQEHVVVIVCQRREPIGGWRSRSW